MEKRPLQHLEGRLKVLALLSTSILLWACGSSQLPTGSTTGDLRNVGPSSSEIAKAPAGQLRALGIVNGDNYLSDLQPTSATNGYGTYENDHSNGDAGASDGRTLTLKGVRFSKGLGVHANSQLVYDSLGACTSFSAQIGIDDEVTGPGSVVFQVYTDGVKVFDSGTITSTSATQAVSVNLAGKRELKLVVTDAGDGNSYDHGDWAGAKLSGCQSDIVGPTGSATVNYLSNETPTSAVNGYGPYEKDKSNGNNAAGDGTTLTLNGVTYPKGLGVHANSQLVYDTLGRCTNFMAKVGVDDEVGNSGSVVFQVFADNVKVFDSGTMTGASATQTVDLSTISGFTLLGKRELKLVVTDAGDGSSYDHGDWADAKLVGCSPNINITQGGTYTGDWESQDYTVPAVKISTTAPVTLLNCTIRSQGNLIAVSGGGIHATVRNCAGYGLVPPSGQYVGYFFQADYTSSVTIENNYLERTGGISLQNWSGNPAAGETITVRYNQIKNIEGRPSDGNGGFSNSTHQIRNFVFINNAQGIQNAEIAWNSVENEPGKSRVEDTINIYGSTGTAASPINIHDNLLRGAYSGPVGDSSYTGGGILADSCSDAYVSIHDNTVVEGSHYGIGMISGSQTHDIEIANNTILTTGKLPDGTLLNVTEAGLPLLNYCNTTAAGQASNKVHDNYVGWGAPSSNNPSNRNDISQPQSVATVTNMQYAAAGAINPQEITNAVNAYYSKVKAQNISIGHK